MLHFCHIHVLIYIFYFVISHERIIPTFVASSMNTIKKVMNMQENIPLLDETRRCWQQMEAFREGRERCKRYCYGDQWGDLVNVGTDWMREEQYIRSQGSEPLKNNLIRRLVRQVLGLYRSETKPLSCVACGEHSAEHSAVFSAPVQGIHRTLFQSCRRIERKGFGRVSHIRTDSAAQDLCSAPRLR